MFKNAFYEWKNSSSPNGKKRFYFACYKWHVINLKSVFYCNVFWATTTFEIHISDVRWRYFFLNSFSKRNRIKYNKWLVYFYNENSITEWFANGWSSNGSLTFNGSIRQVHFFHANDQNNHWCAKNIREKPLKFG